MSVVKTLNIPMSLPHQRTTGLAGVPGQTILCLDRVFGCSARGQRNRGQNANGRGMRAEESLGAGRYRSAGVMLSRFRIQSAKKKGDVPGQRRMRSRES